MGVTEVRSSSCVVSLIVYLCIICVFAAFHKEIQQVSYGFVIRSAKCVQKLLEYKLEWHIFYFLFELVEICLFT